MKKDRIKKINVLHMIYSLYAGGAEEVIAAYAGSYNRKKYNLSVLVITDGGPLIDRIRSYGVSVYALKKQKRLQLKMFYQIYKIMKDKSIDIVHAHNPAGNNWGVIPAQFAGVSVFLRTEHNVYYPGRVTSYYPIINFVLSFFNDRIISCSDIVRKSQIKHYKVPKHKFITIRNGIIPERFQVENEVGYLKKEFGIPQGKKVVGIIGALIEQKGHKYFIEAASIIKEQYPDTYFLVVGDGEKRKELELLSRNKNLTGRMIFTGVRHDIPEILNSIDLFVLSSLWEGLPMVILEAMASKVCIIVTDVGGNSEAIIDKITGFLIQPRDSLGLANRAKFLLANVTLSKKIKDQAYKKFKDNFTVKHMVDKTEKLYEQCMGNSK